MASNLEGAKRLTQAPQLRLRLTSVAESHARRKHPWIFASGVRESNREGRTGEIAVIYDRENHFLGLGLFDADSPIRVRMLHTGKPVKVDEAWWGGRLEAAFARRSDLFSAETDGFRWIHGESDSWPGLVLDRYGEILVLKLYTAAWFPLLPWVISGIGRCLAPTALVLRLSRNIRVAGQVLGLEDGQILSGAMPGDGGRVWFRENGLWFESDVLKGQKTGFFLDQRENRARVQTLSAGRDVLNTFSFTGGFSLYAARGGARSVSSLDLSSHALAGADRSFAKNCGATIPADAPHRTIQADAFQWLAGATPASYDLIVLDPPSLAKREVEKEGALSAYRHLVKSAVRLLRPRGILVAASCSAHVTSSEFFGAVRASAATDGRHFEEKETTLHPPDHPAGFAEGAYLKCIYLEEQARHAAGGRTAAG